MAQRLSCISSQINWQSVILGLLTALFIVISNSACTPNVSTQVNPDAECRVIQHARGETCVPIEPQRLVVLGGLEYVLSLGIKPIGSDGIHDHEVHLNGKIDGIEDIGGNNAPNLEKILNLKPDLILGSEYDNVSYDVLSKIAPTAIFNYEHSGKWKEFFMRYAEALGKTTEAEQVMNQYQARLEKFQQQMGNRAAETEVSIVRVYPTHVSLYLKDSFCGTIVADAGLSRPPSQDLTASEAKTLFGNPIQYEMSREKLQDADGDVIFLWSYGHQDEIAQQAQAEKEKLKTDRLWSRLNAVQQDQVYEVPEYWIGDGPIAANAVIDDLFKYLLNEA